MQGGYVHSLMGMGLAPLEFGYIADQGRGAKEKPVLPGFVHFTSSLYP